LSAAHFGLGRELFAVGRAEEGASIFPS